MIYQLAQIIYKMQSLRLHFYKFQYNYKKTMNELLPTGI